MLLAPIGPLALVLAPSVFRRGRGRLAVHGPADALQHVTRTLGMRWHSAENQNQRKGQDRPFNHFTLPCAIRSKFRIHTSASVPNTAARASVPVATLLPLDGLQDGRHRRPIRRQHTRESHRLALPSRSILT